MTLMNPSHTGEGPLFRNRKRAGAVCALMAIVASAFALMACGEPAAQDPTPVKTWKITPAATDFVVSTTPGVEATKPPAGTPSTEGAVLDLVGVGSVFDLEELEAPAGPITIKFNNQDAGVVHNVAVYPGDDASENPIGATELESGEIEQTLELNLEPGDYFYQCDAHPTTMKGDLKVS